MVTMKNTLTIGLQYWQKVSEKLQPSLPDLTPFMTWDLDCHAEGVLWNRYLLHIIVFKYTLRCEGNIVWQTVSMWQQQCFLSHKVNLWCPNFLFHKKPDNNVHVKKAQLIDYISVYKPKHAK